MEKKSAIKLAKELFKHYPGTNEFFFTEDEQPFFNETDAINHARGFNSEEPAVIPVRRDELEEVSSKSAQLIAAEKAAEKAQANEKAKKEAYEKAANGAAKEKALKALTDAEKISAEASAKLIEVLNAEAPTQ